MVMNGCRDLFVGIGKEANERFDLSLRWLLRLSVRWNDHHQSLYEAGYGGGLPNSFLEGSGPSKQTNRIKNHQNDEGCGYLGNG